MEILADNSLVEPSTCSFVLITDYMAHTTIGQRTMQRTIQRPVSALHAATNNSMPTTIMLIVYNMHETSK